MSESTPSLSRKTFDKFASIIENGQKYLSQDDFLNAIAPPNEDYHKIHRNSYAVLFQVADRSKAGRVSWNDWVAFENMLDKPDAEYEIAFRLFDKDGTGEVDFNEFVEQYNTHRSADALPFNWNSSWANLYLGDKSKRHSLSYSMFSQMLSGLLGERVRQAFQYYDKNQTGYILPEEFQEIITKTASHKLSDNLLDSLHTLCNISNSSKVSYASVRAFLNVVRHVDLVDVIAERATSRSKDGTISRQDFMDEAARSTKFSIFTPLEIEILFHFTSLNNKTGRLSIDDFRRMFDPSWQDSFSRYQRAEKIKVDAAKNALRDPSSFLHEVFESAYNFALGSVAGAFGATVVYPIDLVKTRMQNQRTSQPGQQLLYKNSIDCFKKVVSREGFRGLYSGLGPQLVGVAPEKAIKLTVNDLVRGKFTGADGELPLWAEIVAGGSAGGCQVIFTNPLEIVKIRLQIQGEVAKTVEGAPRRSAIWIVRHLGLVGLYKGATACLLRDVPFSAIYFPAYAHIKKDYFGEGPQKRLSIGQLLIAGAVAGIPAAYLTTPSDVIKTRLQVESRKGQTSYTGLRQAAKTIYKEEGFKAFFKGGPARIFRSSPQFGCTLAAYELLHRLFPLPGHEKTEAGHAVPSAARTFETPVKQLRSRNALKILLDIDENFGKPGVLTPDRAKLIPGLK
ncbi:Agc1p [Sugiyamaella lignohabitans]|uniref:Mitochondrial aspartate-glutamate transporter AGC1 n=1 Tax=Sugiyamaella lignohabitans TaxID=796027 RepID=A0A167DW93_9ASCO|nr:Agc1p [Sugiyamaella lignohabitans]ANB13369.1 Agc1p [Sugiyamaella lignohabitans]